jgi:hypothetical protein
MTTSMLDQKRRDASLCLQSRGLPSSIQSNAERSPFHHSPFALARLASLISFHTSKVSALHAGVVFLVQCRFTFGVDCKLTLGLEKSTVFSVFYH